MGLPKLRASWSNGGPGPGWAANGSDAMDRLAEVDREAFVRRMREDFERTMREVADAVNAAPDGRLIDGSEERCRDALGEFGRRAYEAAVQMRVEATEADPAFSPRRPGGCRGGGWRPGRC